MIWIRHKAWGTRTHVSAPGLEVARPGVRLIPGLTAQRADEELRPRDGPWSSWDLVGLSIQVEPDERNWQSTVRETGQTATPTQSKGVTQSEGVAG